MTTTSYQADSAAIESPTVRRSAADYIWAGLRIALGWVFLWAFLDKMFGLGYATESANAVTQGGSPTAGFLGFATKGPFAEFYQSFAGAAWADVLFMVGLAGIGAALILGIGMRVGAVSGALMLVLMWTAALPPTNNPFMDDHLIYAGLLIGLAVVGAENTLGLGRFWGNLELVKRNAWLK